MLVNNILDIVFPRFCVGCGYVGRYICPHCEKMLEKEESAIRCFYCGKKSYLGVTHPACKRMLGVDTYVFTYSYSDLFRKVIHIVKYGGAYDILREMVLFLPDKALCAVLRWNRLFYLEPQTVPLSEKKRNERGFNQVDYIASPTLSILKRSAIAALKKTKETKSQATLHVRKERRDNIKDSFECVADVRGKNILLIDDVVTTGSTVKECTKTLKKSGARRVCVLSLARG